MDFQSYSAFKHSSFSGLIGVAQEDITPPIGIYSRNWGASKYDVAEGLHRPIMLTCLTFQSSKQEKPFNADTYAMPAPIIPAPNTPIFLIFVSGMPLGLASPLFASVILINIVRIIPFDSGDKRH